MRGRAVVLALVAALLGTPAPAGAQDWTWPLPGRPVVDRGFEPPTTAYGAGHRGVDLRGATGQPVLAAGAGRVAYAGLLAGRGVVTVVHAGGLRTTYEPVTAGVRVGQAVGVGQPLGLLAPGHCRDGGACLHWGLLRGAVYLDPLALVGTGPVRLLPLDDPSAAPPAMVAAPTTAKGPVPGRPQPRLLLRAADRGLGVLAVLLLALGLSMIVRRPPPRQGPASGALPVPVDLATERTRRRAG